MKIPAWKTINKLLKDIIMKIYILFIAICTSTLLKAQNNPELMKQMQEMRKETDPVKSLAFMKTIIKNNNLQEEKDGETIDIMKGEVAIDYLNAGKYVDFEQCIYTMRNKFNQTSYMNYGAAT